MRILKAANTMDGRNTGMGRAMHRTADEMREMGHAVDVWFENDVPRSRTGRFDRFTYPIALVRAVRRAMKERGKYDIVEIHEPSAAWYCLLRRRGADLPPCVVISHGLEQAQWGRRLELDRILTQRTSLKSRVMVPATLLSQARYGLRHCEQVMCLNSDDSQFLRDVLRIPPQRITVYQNGVDPSFIMERQPMHSGALPRLLFVGSWLPRKGRQVLVDAFARLQRRHAGLQLSIIGSGVSNSEVLDLFSPESRPNVRVVPRADDVELRREYSTHNIFVFPSYHEPWGLTSMEAAAAGLAVVTTRSGGPCDLFTDRKNSLLVQPANATAVADAVIHLIENPDAMWQLQMNAQDLARQFTWRAAAHTQLRAYERALQNARSTADTCIDCGEQPPAHAEIQKI